LSLVQAALIAVPRPLSRAAVPRLKSRWWGLVPPASIALVIGVIAAYGASADALAYLALVAVPILACVALARLVPAARPRLALVVPPLFVAAWAFHGSTGGELAALALSALACVTLGVLLASQVPPRWLTLGVYAMAVVDAGLVITDLLQGPNGRLIAASPAGGLPHLQVAQFGSAVMGFGDLFIAATVGALLAGRPRSQRSAAVLAAVLCLGFDLLFLFVDELPTTVPIALTLAIVAARERRPKRSMAALAGT
jgi:hypothetical protein